MSHEPRRNIRERIRYMASHATGDGAIPSRDAAKHGLKRIMTLGGAYGTRNYTVKDLRDQKDLRDLKKIKKRNWIKRNICHLVIHL